MKRNKIYALLASMLLLPSAHSFGQQALRSAYFLEGYNYRHQMNPAFASERNYVSFPLLGNLNMGAQGNVGLSNFLYKKDGQLTTFLNESVSSKEFLDGLSNTNRINANLNLTLMSVGFSAWGGYNTIDLGIRSTTSMTLPYDLFSFMKNGMTSEDTRYNMENIGIRSTNFAEIALGHSHKINDKLNIGAKVKFLLGLAYADMKISNMNVQLSEDKWMIEANGEMNTSVKGLILPTKEESGKELDSEEQKDLVDWDEIDFDSPGLTGFGMAFDFGATYKVMDDLEVSAALLDVGFISWKNTTKAVTSNKPWEFDGFKNIAIDDPDSENDFENQWENLSDDLEDFTNFHRTKTNAKNTTALGATLNIGAEYKLPYYRNLKFGFLSSTRIQGNHSWSEGRFSATVAPVKFFDASINYGVSTFGSSFGWIINFHPKGFNLFIGSDHQIFKVTPQFVPVHNANANISLGINFPIGSRKSL